LSESERLVLSLHVYDELSFEEIGAVLDVAPPQAEVLYRAAVAHLETCIRFSPYLAAMQA
jgi:DNA-directed RNA polymerase specialized sigma24 family protein